MNAVTKNSTPDMVSQTRVLQRLYLTLMFRGRRTANRGKRISRPAVSFSASIVAFGVIGSLAFWLSNVGLLGFAGSLHAMTFLMIGMNLAATSGSILFSTEEADVLLHRPVEPRALLAAKVRVIVLVSLALAFSFNAFGFYVGMSRPDGSLLFLPAHLLSLTLEVIFCVSFVVLAYNLCLRCFGRERLENLMTTVQVVVAVAAMVGGQFMSRIVNGLDQITASALPSWLAVLPPAWFGALDVVLSGKSSSPALVALAIWGIVATVAISWLGVSHLATTYEQGLVALNEAGSAAVKPGNIKGKRVLRLLQLPLIRTWLRDPVERSAFRLAIGELTRSRGVKLRIYPMLAQFIACPLFIFLAGAGRSNSIRDPLTVAFAGGFIAMVPVIVLDRLRPSEDWRAADIFRQAPLSRPSALFHGTRKAVILVLCVPAMLLVLVLGMIWMKQTMDTVLLLLPSFMAMQIFSLLPALGRTYLPFSLQPELESQNAQGCLLAGVFMVGAGIVAGLTSWAWMMGWFGWLLLGEICLAIVLYILLNRLIDHRPLAPER